MSKKIELLTRQAAAERLKLSPRRLSEMAVEGKLTGHRAFDPETRRAAVMFDAAEIEAYRSNRHYDTSGTPAPAGTTAALVRTAPRRFPRGDDFAALDEGDMESDWNASMAGVGRLFLTLAEAAEYSGLPASHLRAMIEAGELKARDVGPRPGGHWRVRRLDLDAIEGENNAEPARFGD